MAEPSLSVAELVTVIAAPGPPPPTSSLVSAGTYKWLALIYILCVSQSIHSAAFVPGSLPVAVVVPADVAADVDDETKAAAENGLTYGINPEDRLANGQFAASLKIMQGDTTSHLYSSISFEQMPFL